MNKEEEMCYLINDALFNVFTGMGPEDMEQISHKFECKLGALIGLKKYIKKHKEKVLREIAVKYTVSEEDVLDAIILFAAMLDK